MSTQTGNIAIGTNNAVLSGTNQIFIGANNKTTTINGVTNINTTGSALTTIGATGNNMNISGTAINIGNTAGNLATNGVNIASGTNVAGSSVFLGSDTLPNCYIRGNYVNINHQTSKNTNIGSDSGGTTTLLGNLEVGSNGAGTINLWRPITTKYIPSAITNSYQVGWYENKNFDGVQIAYGGGDRTYTYWEVPPGIYSCTYGSIANRQTNFFKTLFFTTTTRPNANYTFSVTGGGRYCAESENDNGIGYPGFTRYSGSAIIKLEFSGFIGLIQNVYAVNSPVDFIGYSVSIVRIA